MSVFSSWSYTAKATFWAPTLDEFGEPSAWARSVFDCSFTAGGNLGLDSVFEQFQPKTTIYLEASDLDAPQEGWYVVTEESADASPPDTAEIVRMVMKYDPSTFIEGLPDRKVVTG